MTEPTIAQLLAEIEESAARFRELSAIVVRRLFAGDVDLDPWTRTRLDEALQRVNTDADAVRGTLNENSRAHPLWWVEEVVRLDAPPKWATQQLRFTAWQVGNTERAAAAGQKLPDWQLELCARFREIVAGLDLAFDDSFLDAVDEPHLEIVEVDE